MESCVLTKINDKTALKQFYNIKYSARLCFPIENTMIIARITTMNKQFFVAENGPITK